MSEKQIGCYQIKEKLGRGGMAVVYLAHDPGFGRDVAVKVLSENLLDDPEFRARFEQEAKTIATLEHPAIVPVYDFGEEGNQPYFVMRYMSGGSLRVRLRNGPLHANEVGEILTHLAPALDKVHQNGFIHRDIKPDNVLFDEDGKPYLADFGIARIVVAGQVTFAGTGKYMAPEQRQCKELDARTDIYQLGMTVFEMLTGRLPKKDDIPSVHDYKPALSHRCDQVIARALAKRKDERYSTASEFATAFAEAISGSPKVAESRDEETPTEPVRAAPPTPNIDQITETNRGAAQNAEPLAIIIKVQPEVKVMRAGTDHLQPARFGMPLQRGDVVMTFDQAACEMFCQNGLIFSLPQRSNLTVECRQDVPSRFRLPQILKKPLVNVFSFLFTAANVPFNWKRPSGRRRTRTHNKMPILLTPRNTLIADSRPTFRWQPVPGASGYRVRMIMRRGKGWERDTTDAYLRYPDDEPALSPADKRNIVTVAALDHLRVADQGWLRVMDESSRGELAQAEAALQTLEVDEVAKRYLLAQLYRQVELHSAAIRELVYLTETSEHISANLWKQLGDLYLEVQLYAQAKECYQTVLNATDAGKQIQASAYVGLARVAHAPGNTQQAREILTTAETLYREVGDVERAELIIVQKSKLSHN